MAIRLANDFRMPATDNASSSVNAVTLPILSAGITPIQDDIIIFVLNVLNATQTPSVSTTGGQTWTAGTQLQANGLTVNYFWCRVDSTGLTADPIVSWTTAAPYVLWGVVDPNVDTTTAIDAAAVLTSQAAAATYTNGASYITTATNGAVVIHAMCSSDNNTWNGHTSTDNLPCGRTGWRNGSGAGCSMTVAHVTQASAGGSAACAATQATLGNDAGIRFAVALRPASVSAVANFTKVEDLSIVSGSSTAITKSSYPGPVKFGLGMMGNLSAVGAGNGLDVSLGVIAGRQQTSIHFGNQDNVGFSNSTSAQSLTSFFQKWAHTNHEVAGDKKFEAAIRSTADGVKLTPTTASDANYLGYGQFWGGDDIEAVALATIALPTATGSVNYDTLFPFKCDDGKVAFVVVHAGINQTTFPMVNSLATADTDDSPQLGFGVCDPAFNQAGFCAAIDSEAIGAEVGSSIVNTSAAYVEFEMGADFGNASTPPSAHGIRYVGQITGGRAFGLTINWTTVSGTTAAANLRTIIAIRLSSTGKFRVWNGDSRTATGDLAITNDAGGTALGNAFGAFVVSGLSGTAGSARQDLEMSLGMTDGTNHRALGAWQKEGGGSSGSVPSDNRTFLTSSYCFYDRTNNSTSGAEGSATASSLTGGITLTFDDGSPTASKLFGFSFEPAAATGTTGTLAATTPLPTLAAAGSPTVSGTLAATTPLPTLASSGTSTVTGTAAPTTPLPTLAAAGNSTITGTMAATTDMPSLAASGTVGTSGTTGTLAATTDVPTLAAAGSPVASGAMAATTPLPTLAAAGAPTVTGTMAATTPLPTLQAGSSAGARFNFRTHPIHKQDRNVKP